MDPSHFKRCKKMSSWNLLTIFLCLGLSVNLPKNASAQKSELLQENTTSDFSFRSQYQQMFLHYPVQAYSLSSESKTLVSDTKRLRLSPEFTIMDSLMIYMDIDNTLIHGNYLQSPEFFSLWQPPSYNDLLRLEKFFSNNQDLFLKSSLHRLFLKIRTSKLTITAGRQLVRFGSGRLWNPLDIMNPISPISIQGSDDLKGIDALRVEYFLFDTAVISIVFEPKRYQNNDDIKNFSGENINSAVRIKVSMGDLEVAGLYGFIAHRHTLGIDLSTIFLNGMLRASILYSKPETSPENNIPFFQASAGYEYTFSHGIYFLAEYFFNENGLHYKENLMDLFLESRTGSMNEKIYRGLANQFLTLNKHYTAVALGYNISPLFRGDFFLIYDFQGMGLFINPTIRYNAFENFDVSLSILKAILWDNAMQKSDFAPFQKGIIFYASLSWHF